MSQRQMFNLGQDGKVQFKRWNLTTELLLEVVLVSDKLSTPLRKAAD
jgi:hypothetical protein